MKRGSGALAVFAAAVLLAAAAGRSAPQAPRLLPVDAGLVSSFAFDPRRSGHRVRGDGPRPQQRPCLQDDRRRGALAVDLRARLDLARGTRRTIRGTRGRCTRAQETPSTRRPTAGQTWRAFNRGLLPPPGINRGEGWVDWLAVDPTKSNVLYEHDYANTIRKSLDGGQSWNPVLSLWRKGGISGAADGRRAVHRPSTRPSDKWGPGGAKPWA